jgi:Inner membrane protein YgaP-like, transmembrane domain
MTYQETHFPNVNNIGPLDRINRIIVGTTLITVMVLFTAIPAATVASVVAIGMYAGLTGFIGWDPLYALVKGVQKQAPAQTPATVSAYRRRGEQPSTGSYKKAA